MKHLLSWAGRQSGLAGAVATLPAVASRPGGQWPAGPLSHGVGVPGGVARMAIGCPADVAALAGRDR